MSEKGFVAGFVTLLGRPNAGKSTLLNSLLGTKLSIVADKPQTTRTAVQGVLTEENAQIVLLDTPGIHSPTSQMNRRMMDTVRTALAERDLLLYLADATHPPNDAELEAIKVLQGTETPVFLVLNKIDQVRNKQNLLPVIEAFTELHAFREIIPISALTGEGVDRLKDAIRSALPQGRPYFPDDYLTDRPERFLAAEIIREKIIRATREEVPHSTAVIIDVWEEKPNITRVSASIVVERAGQKGIIIGAGGAMLKKIGTAARQEMEALLGRRFYLELFVKVREKWRESQAFLNDLDYQAQPSLAMPTVADAPEDK